MPPAQAKPAVCGGCDQEFPSKSALFKHLKQTNGACLSQEDRDGFQEYLESIRERVLILYGYQTSPKFPNGEDLSQFLLSAIKAKEVAKTNRSYANNTQQNDLSRQDDHTGAITEVIVAFVSPIGVPTMQQWIDETNQMLSEQLSDCDGAVIRILGRMKSPSTNFHAESDASSRRSEYMLPADFLFDGKGDILEYFASLQAFPEGNASHKEQQDNRADLPTIKYLFSLKKIMQTMTTKVVELDDDLSLRREKEYLANKKNKVEEKSGKKRKHTQPKSRVLQRKRFHNFSPKTLAHDFLSYRRVDRFYHRATLHFRDGIEIPKEEAGSRPFIVLSISGDLFLQEQICRMVGLFVAIARGFISSEILDCIFDENFPPLVPTPPMPVFACCAAEALYSSWEGKTGTVLTPRKTNKFKKGWFDDDTLRRVKEWSKELRQGIVQRWLSTGEENGVLAEERNWVEHVLKPWSEEAEKQLDRYHKWKASVEGTQQLLPSILTIDQSVPEKFEKVLQYLREIDRNGSWPSTSSGRQLVMVSTRSDIDPSAASESLAVQRSKAKTKDFGDRVSAYTFKEGEGGASGSFSVGFMPDDGCTQPRANEQFPELTKAAFELEIALCPHREPSSTIAINRNAQFRPHVDSGAGAGQSRSLIVGLGNYVGGELVVEGDEYDIRYIPKEFNGWKQRHWTMPFKGERFSLVWFTPKGCEGKRGIDIFASNNDN